MKPLDTAYMLSIDTKLTKENLRKIYKAGYSRIPIYDKTKDNIVGILLTRELILINPDKAIISIRQLFNLLVRNVVQVDANTKLEKVLAYFKRGHSHMGVVTQLQQRRGDWIAQKVGIVTLEDIIDQLLSLEDKEREDRSLRNEMKNKLVLLFSSDK